MQTIYSEPVSRFAIPALLFELNQIEETDSSYNVTLWNEYVEEYNHLMLEASTLVDVAYALSIFVPNIDKMDLDDRMKEMLQLWYVKVKRVLNGMPCVAMYVLESKILV